MAPNSREGFDLFCEGYARPDNDRDDDDCNSEDNTTCYRPSQSSVTAFRLYPVSQASHFTDAGVVCADILHDVHPVEHSVNDISKIN